jgi:regulator of protease activity HflC (stomatin/prohibitin superfamily)
LSKPDASKDPYAPAVFALIAVSSAATVAAWMAWQRAANPVLAESSVTALIATGVLIGVALTQRARLKPESAVETVPPAEPTAVAPRPEEPVPVAASESTVVGDEVVPTPPQAAYTYPLELDRRAKELYERVRRRLDDTDIVADSRVVTVVVAALVFLYIQRSEIYSPPLERSVAIIVAALCLAGAGLAATAVRYLSGVDRAVFPEGRSLTRGARVLAWIGVVAALSVGLQWFEQMTAVRVLSAIVAVVNIALASELLESSRRSRKGRVHTLDFSTLSVLGSRTNVIGSILDAAERQLGIDLRSTWALMVIRHSVEPLIIGLAAVAWLSTSLTVVGVQEQGLVERLGVPVGGPPMLPGLHVHFPWPIDSVIRLPVMRVQRLSVGHEGEEEGGPEDVLWARQHAANEYTLLLGDGRDLITVDAAVMFRISDPRAWQYHSQNPADALRAIAHRAVMRTTVNKILSEALSENVVKTTAVMRQMVQDEADQLGLGVEVMSFTVGGMHPPVTVAPDYQSVVSAELGKVTAIVSAQADRNRTVPEAEAWAVASRNAAIAEGALAAARASGEAWSFTALQSQYKAAPSEYFFRRRLEELEQILSARQITILDARIQRDGGELWLIP